LKSIGIDLKEAELTVSTSSIADADPSWVCINQSKEIRTQTKAFLAGEAGLGCFVDA
jgi:hypothetical protein